MKKRAAAAVAALATVGAVLYGYQHYAARYPSTDDAYVIAAVVHVAPQVAGQVATVQVSDQQYVHRGDTLYAVDAKPFELAVELARANLAQVRQQVASAAAAVTSAEADQARLQVLLDNAELRARRSHDLQNASYLSRQAADDAEADRRAAEAALAVGRARLAEARAQLGAPGEENESIRAAKAALGDAQWRLDHTTVTAACDGRIAEKHLNPGDAVKEGAPNFVLVCDGAYWVEANFKETDLARIHTGQPVTIDLDMYPGIAFRGSVENVGGASGVAFSLLPPQNASGNWVKVTQRVPVRIKVLGHDADHQLRVGTSAQVKVDTTGG